MGIPRITYNGKTIDFPLQILAFNGPPIVPRSTKIAQTGVVESALTPRIDTFLRVEFRLFDSLTLRVALENFLQWAQRAKPFTFSVDSDYSVDTELSLKAAAGDSAVYVKNPAGIAAGVYKVISGSNRQLVTVASVQGDKLTLSDSLNDDMAKGAIFRSPYHFVGVMRNTGESPIREASGGEEGQPSWPPTRFYFTLEFFEDTAQEETVMFRRLSSDVSGQDVNTAQPWFPSSGGVSLAAATTYKFQGVLRLSRAAGTTAHSLSLLFGGTATLAGILWKAHVNTGDTVGNAAANQTSAEVATATQVKGSSSSATEQVSIEVQGIAQINGAGSFIPQFQYSSAPGGAPLVLANTHFFIEPIGAGSVTSEGTWA